MQFHPVSIGTLDTTLRKYFSICSSVSKYIYLTYGIFMFSSLKNAVFCMYSVKLCSRTFFSESLRRCVPRTIVLSSGEHIDIVEIGQRACSASEYSQFSSASASISNVYTLGNVRCVRRLLYLSSSSVRYVLISNLDGFSTHLMSHLSPAQLVKLPDGVE